MHSIFITIKRGLISVSQDSCLDLLAYTWFSGISLLCQKHYLSSNYRSVMIFILIVNHRLENFGIIHSQLQGKCIVFQLYQNGEDELYVCVTELLNLLYVCLCKQCVKSNVWIQPRKFVASDDGVFLFVARWVLSIAFTVEVKIFFFR